MTARIGAGLSVVVIGVLVATCSGGGGPTSPSLDQETSEQGQEAGNDGLGGGLDGLVTCPTPGNADKAIICHLPPGNPGNARAICIDPSAVPAHLGHGDYLGECRECPPGDPYCCPPGDPYCVGPG